MNRHPTANGSSTQQSRVARTIRLRLGATRWFIAARVIPAAFALCGASSTMADGGVAAAIAPGAALTRAESGHYVSPVTVNGGGPFDFVVDTGAEGCAVYQQFADERGLPLAGEESLQGQTGTTTIRLARVDSIVTAGVSAGPLSCAVLPPRRDGARLNGIVGLDSMTPYAVLFDTAKSRLTFYASGVKPTDCLGAGYVAIAARHLDSTLLAFAVSINGANGTAVLDSGARRSVINRKFAVAAGVDLQALQADAPLYGATGVEQELRHGRLGTLAINGRAWPEVSGTVADLPVFEAFGVADEPAMILGLDFLEGGALLVDFPAMMVYIARP